MSVQVSGFTIVRDAQRLDYPAVESIRSLLPLVDEMVVLVGDSCDDTLNLIRQIESPKLIIRESVWDPAMRRGGQVLAHQTNLALDLCQGEWCFYLQADEVVHENDLDRISAAMKRHRRRKEIEGLSFRYHHFMGDYAIKNPLAYRKQVRVVRNGYGIRSVGDACGFAREGRKLKTASSHGWVYHYGWVRPPQQMGEKNIQLGIFYVEDQSGMTDEQTHRTRQAELTAVATASPWNYDLSACVPFRQSHPAVMAARIAAKDWQSPPFHYVPWWRNKHFWGGMWQKNFASIHRALASRSRKAA